jgi:hypothetical protein
LLFSLFNERVMTLMDVRTMSAIFEGI